MSKQDPRLEKANTEKYNALCAELGMFPGDARKFGYSLEMLNDWKIYLHEHEQQAQMLASVFESH